MKNYSVCLTFISPFVPWGSKKLYSLAIHQGILDYIFSEISMIFVQIRHRNGNGYNIYVMKVSITTYIDYVRRQSFSSYY